MIPILGAPRLSDGACIDENIAGSHYVQGFTVQSLMSAQRKEWNTPLVRHVFSHDIADVILHTPLFEQVQTDHLVWKAERNGCYSIRSAYRLYVEEMIDVTHLHRLGNWKDIWHLKVPPKIKHMLWRCAGDALLLEFDCKIRVLRADALC